MDRQRSVRTRLFLLITMLVVACPGCSLWGRSEVKQYELENERLLTDFRAQRDRAERLEIEKRALVSRLQDLENRFAAISDVLKNPATSPLNPGPNRPPSQTFLPASQPVSTTSPPNDEEPNNKKPPNANGENSPPPATDSWQTNQ